MFSRTRSWTNVNGTKIHEENNILGWSCYHYFTAYKLGLRLEINCLKKKSSLVIKSVEGPLFLNIRYAKTRSAMKLEGLKKAQRGQNKNDLRTGHGLLDKIRTYFEMQYDDLSCRTTLTSKTSWAGCRVWPRNCQTTDGQKSGDKPVESLLNVCPSSCALSLCCAYGLFYGLCGHCNALTQVTADKDLTRVVCVSDMPINKCVGFFHILNMTPRTEQGCLEWGTRGARVREDAHKTQKGE